MTRNKIGYRRADHLRWRKTNENDKPRKGSFLKDQWVPVRKEDGRNEDGVITQEGINAAPCLPDLMPYGDCLNMTCGVWKERRTGWGVRYTRPIYLVENGVLYEGAERRETYPPVED
jgi:hypothetical protein